MKLRKIYGGKDMIRLKNKVFYVCIIALLLSGFAYAEETKTKQYKYAELVVVNRFYDVAGGIAEMSTTVYLNDGSDKEISSYRKESIISYKDAKHEAFRDFIEKYSNKKFSNSKVSEMYVLNTLGSDGWEVISYDDKPLNFVEGSGSKARYLLRKEKP
jgi:uncharacterized membrane protein